MRLTIIPLPHGTPLSGKYCEIHFFSEAFSLEPAGRSG